MIRLRAAAAPAAIDYSNYLILRSHRRKALHMTSYMQPHHTLAALLRKISTVQMKGPRFTHPSFWNKRGIGFFLEQIIRTDRGSDRGTDYLLFESV